MLSGISFKQAIERAPRLALLPTHISLYTPHQIDTKRRSRWSLNSSAIH
ncbi:hypothetical protein THOD03_30212 [Vibrio harveyi]|nr:hypothetical protein THOD03_30212 [Vibrio harveyi]